MKTTDRWYSDPGGVECAKNKCRKKATFVGLASPHHRVVSCDAHEDELKALVALIRANPVPGPNDLAPTETIMWRRDDR